MRDRLRVQRMPAGGGQHRVRPSDGPLQTAGTAAVDLGIQSPAAPIAAPTLGVMESRFGHDFSQVRIHSDADASESAEALEARAYTVGSDIVFQEGLFAPHSTEGERLLAHELAHVVQQDEACATAGSNLEGLRVSQPGDSSEQEADAAAGHVQAGRSVSVDSAPTADLARDEDDENLGLNLGSKRGLVTDDHQGEKLDLLNFQLQAGKFGDPGKKRYGLHGAAGLLNYNQDGGPQGGDAQVGMLNVDANAGADGFTLGAGATAAQVAARGGDMSARNGEETRFGLSAGPSIGMRGSWGKEADGRRAYGIGGDLGFASFDLKTKDPLGTLMKHEGLFTGNPLTQGAEGGASLARMLGLGPKEDPGAPSSTKDPNMTEDLATWLKDPF